jgi:ABC-type uncharacterized transport system substrate-binding protein
MTSTPEVARQGLRATDMTSPRGQAVAATVTRLGLAVALVVLATPPTIPAQQLGKVARVGFLGTTPTPPLEGLIDGLRQLGWVEAQNLIIERRFSEGKQERLGDLAAELVRLNVDVIVTSGTPASLAAQRATSTVPIVVAVVIDPVGSGLVASLARPGGNITGMSWLGPELSAKRLELLKETVPRISRVAVLFNPSNPAHRLALRDVQTMATRLGMTLQFHEIRSPDDFDRAFIAVLKERSDALLTVADPLTFRERTRIVQFAAKSRLPAIYEWREFVELGGLMAYGVNLTDLFRRAATYVDRILKGTKPGDLPIERPTRFELIVNQKTAQALGLTLPLAVLLRADQVID